MRALVFLLIVSLLSYPGKAEDGEKKIVSYKHLSEARQIHVKPVMLFGDLGVLLGPSVGLEVPIMPYFSLGGVFNAIFNFKYKTTMLDFDAVAKAKYPMRLGAYDAAAYAAFPIGFSLWLLPRTVQAGFNFAALPGFEFYIDRHWGIFTELGFSIHAFSPSMTQGQFSIGISYLF